MTLLETHSNRDSVCQLLNYIQIQIWITPKSKSYTFLASGTLPPFQRTPFCAPLNFPCNWRSGVQNTLCSKMVFMVVLRISAHYSSILVRFTKSKWYSWVASLFHYTIHTFIYSTICYWGFFGLGFGSFPFLMRCF